MIVHGYALVRIEGNEELQWWNSIPARIDVPGAEIVIFEAKEGGDYHGYTIVARDKEFPDPTPVIPFSITDRQFGDALYTMGVITHEERMAFGKVGDLPAQMAAVIALIEDEEQRRRAEYLASTAQTFERNHPITLMLQISMGWSDEQVDQLWVLGASL